jgi:hypothetical protein
MDATRTDLLNELRAGGRDDVDRLLPVVYSDLREIERMYASTARGRGAGGQASKRSNLPARRLVVKAPVPWVTPFPPQYYNPIP